MDGTSLTAQQLQESVALSQKRVQNFRKARTMFIRQFVGQYYDAQAGTIGTEPLNLIFNAIRVLVPNIVFNFPKHVVTTPFLAQREYGNMLGLALSQQDKQLKIRDLYRRAIVDALFTMGISKTGIADSGSAIYFDEDDQIDPGTVYTELVDFDNFLFDPAARRLEDALYLGDRMCVPRQGLLESGLYDNALIEKLPRAYSPERGEKRVESLSMRSVSPEETGALEDMVEIAELWVPRAQALVTVPACEGYSADDYLRVTDFNGPNSGPYSFLRFTPPVPNNPLPVALVGIWYDLHVMANRMTHKIMTQADRQKDVIGYKRSAADDAQEALDARDGEAVAMDDPEGVKTFSFGGQQRSNEAHIDQLQSWFNMMAANPQGVGGVSMDAGSATEASILQNNASVTLEDMKDAVYQFSAEEAGKRAWYLHTDPLLEVPLTRRVKTPGIVIQTPAGPMMQPAEEQEVQVMLTPEARSGDFLAFTFSIEPESMGRVDSAKRQQAAMEFAVKVIPAAAQAAQVCMQMGVPFSFARFVSRMAEQAGITWMDEVFQDPEFQQRMMMLQMRGPQADGSKGTTTPAAIGGGMSGIMQNGQPPGVGAVMDPATQARSDQQMGAAAGQAALPNRSAY